MKAKDNQLRQMFVSATDEVVPPAPWLEGKITESLRQRRRQRPSLSDRRELGWFPPGLRIVAAIAAVLIAVASVAALLMGSRLAHRPEEPGGRPTAVQTPADYPIIPFAPSPAVRDPSWPAGGPVPAALTGAWRQETSAGLDLHLAAYTFQLGEERDGPNINPPAFGNVVVNGSEIDFMSDVCTRQATFGLERFTYTLTGTTLVITRLSGPGQSQCNMQGILWPNLGGTYTRVS